MLAKKPKGAVEKRQSSGMASLLWMFVGALLTVMCLVVLYLWNPFDIGSETKTEQRTVEPINQQSSTDEGNNFEFYDLLPDQEMISLPDEAVFDEDSATSSDDLEPDVVVTQPNTQQRRDSSLDNSENFGISEERTINTAPQQQTPARGEQDIVIVEEEGTYDDPVAEGNQNSNTQGAATNRSQSGRNASQATANSTSAKPSYILQINSFSNAEEADKRRAQVLMAGVDAHVVKSRMSNGQVVYQVVSPTMTNRQKVVSAQQRLQNNGIDSLIVEQRR